MFARRKWSTGFQVSKSQSFPGTIVERRRTIVKQITLLALLLRWAVLQ